MRLIGSLDHPIDLVWATEAPNDLQLLEVIWMRSVGYPNSIRDLRVPRFMNLIGSLGLNRRAAGRPRRYAESSEPNPAASASSPPTGASPRRELTRPLRTSSPPPPSSDASPVPRQRSVRSRSYVTSHIVAITLRRQLCRSSSASSPSHCRLVRACAT